MQDERSTHEASSLSADGVKRRREPTTRDVLRDLLEEVHAAVSRAMRRLERMPSELPVDELAHRRALNALARAGYPIRRRPK